MKPLLLILSFLFLHQAASAQSADYLSIRKKSGRVVKNFYAGGYIELITVDNSYIAGPIQAVRNDSLFVTIYDVRSSRTVWGSILRDTVTVQTVSLHNKDIKRIQLESESSAFQRLVPPIMMIGGAGYATLNVVNGVILNQSISGNRNLRRLGTAVGIFGLGFLLNKLFASDGFTKAKHRIVYVDL